MAWIYLILAGLAEIGWPLGLKWAQQNGRHWQGLLTAAFFMVLSGWLLFLAQKSIPMGTAYAVWTGIGAAGAFAVGILLFGDAVSFGRTAGALLIVAGVIVMKLSA